MNFDEVKERKSAESRLDDKKKTNKGVTDALNVCDINAMVKKSKAQDALFGVKSKLCVVWVSSLQKKMKEKKGNQEGRNEWLRTTIKRKFNQESEKALQRTVPLRQLSEQDPPLLMMTRLHVAFQNANITIFKKGATPGYSGKMCDIILSYPFWEKLKEAFHDNVLDLTEIGKLQLYFCKYKVLDTLFRDFQAVPKGEAPALAEKMRTLAVELERYYIKNLLGYGHTDYAHVILHAPEIMLLHAEYQLPLGALGCGAQELHNQQNKIDNLEHMCPANEDPPSMQLMRLQCHRFYPLTREAAEEAKKITKKRAPRTSSGEVL